MYNYILFKNTRGTTKLNVKLKEPIRSLADLSDIQSNIIFYITENNGYNFILSKEVDTSSVGVHENVFNQYILADFYNSRYWFFCRSLTYWKYWPLVRLQIKRSLNYG